MLYSVLLLCLLPLCYLISLVTLFYYEFTTVLAIAASVFESLLELLPVSLKEPSQVTLSHKIIKLRLLITVIFTINICIKICQQNNQTPAAYRRHIHNIHLHKNMPTK